jgi:hypothetical protein
MAVFTVSDNTIDALKKKKLWIVILLGIFGMIIGGSLTYFSMVIISKISIEIFIISFSISLVIISLTLFFSLKSSLKILEKEMKSIQYIIGNERLIIKRNDFEQYNISKNEIQCINRYKNNEILIILNTKKKITVDKYLENFDQLNENLSVLSQVNYIDKNPSILKKIGIGIIQIIIIGTLLISDNIIFVAASGVIAIIYCVNNYFDKSIDIKRRKLILVCVILIVLLKIIRLML